VDVRAWTRGLLFIDKGAFHDVEGLIVLVVFDACHAIAGIPLHEHHQLTGLRMVDEDLPVGTWPKFLPREDLAIHVRDQPPDVVGVFHDPCSFEVSPPAHDRDALTTAHV
jgi:hypothetical protein